MAGCYVARWAGAGRLHCPVGLRMKPADPELRVVWGKLLCTCGGVGGEQWERQLGNSKRRGEPLAPGGFE